MGSNNIESIVNDIMGEGIPNHEGFNQKQLDVIKSNLSKDQLNGESSQSKLQNIVEMLQQSCQEKNIVTSYERRDMETLIDYVKKRIDEETECTFKPKINPKSTKIV